MLINNNNNDDDYNENQNGQLYKNIKLLKWNQKVFKEKTFRKPCFIGTQKSQNINVESKV